MDRPWEYREQRITARHTPYEQEDTHAGSPVTTGGVLAKGSTVWLRASAAAQTVETASGRHVIPAFADGVGIILLDRRWLSSEVPHVPERRPQPAAPGIHLIEVPRAKASRRAGDRIGPGLVETEPAKRKNALAG